MKVFWGILACFVVVSLFLFDFLININRPVSLNHGDYYLVLLTFKHFFKIFAGGDWQNLLNLPIFYGFNNSLGFSEPWILEGILFLPLFAVFRDPILSFNSLSYLTVFGSFVATYFLILHFTNSIKLSILMSIIFIFNPFTMARFPDDIMIYSLGWIPLIFLFLEKMLKKQNRLTSFLFFLSLTCLLFSSSVYTVFILVILPIYVVFRALILKIDPKKLVNTGSIVGMLLFIGAGLALNTFYAKYTTKIVPKRTIDEVQFYSAWPTDLLFADENNWLYGKFRNLMPDFGNQIFYKGLETQERDLFWGIIPTLFLIIGIFQLKSPVERELKLLFLGLFLMTLILAFGPQIHLWGNLNVFGLYNLLYYFLNPVFGYVRGSSRVFVFTYLFLMLFCALTISKFFKNLNPKLSLVIFFLLLAAIVGEYWRKPLQYEEFGSQIQALYSKLEAQKEMKVILELPIGNSNTDVYTLASNQFVDSRYIGYATIFHSKKLINGYSSYFPSGYLQRVEYLSANFPNKTKLEAVKEWQVDAIILHQSEYDDSHEYERVRKSFADLKVPLAFEGNGLALYDLRKWGKQTF